MLPLPTDIIPKIDLSYWILQTLAMCLTCLVIPKLKITHPLGAIMAVVAISFINTTVWDAALFFQIPDHLTSQAVTLFIANGVLFWLVIKFMPGIEISGVLPALAAPIVFTISSLVVEKYGSQVDWIQLGKDALAMIDQLREGLRSSASR